MYKVSSYAILHDISQPIRNTFCPLCLWDGASFDCWEIYDVTQNKIKWTQLWHEKCQCARQPITTELQHVDNERAGGESPIPGSQHNNEALWTLLAVLLLLSSAFCLPLRAVRWWVIILQLGTAWHIQLPRWSSPWFSWSPCLLLGSIFKPMKFHTHFGA